MGTNKKTITLPNEQVKRYAEDISEIFNRLYEAQIFLRNILENIEEAVVGVDSDFKIIEYNASFSSLVESSPDNKIGIPLHSLLSEPFWIPIFPAMDCPPKKEQIDIHASENRGKWFRVIRLPISKLSHVIGYIYFISDETNRERVKRLKNEFISNVYHEFDTPIAAVDGFIEIIQEELSKNTHPELRNHIKDLEQNVWRIHRVVHEMMDLSDTVSNELLENEVVDLTTTANQAIADCLLRSQQKNITIGANILSDCTTMGVLKLIHNAMIHLIENAIEFSRENSVIRVTLDLSGGNYQFTVKDEGVGIPKAELKKIFDLFYQVEPSLTRSHNGLGVGLTFVQHVAHIHHGEITVESTAGKGTIARLKLPNTKAKGLVCAGQTVKEAENSTSSAKLKELEEAKKKVRELEKKLQAVQNQAVKYAGEIQDLYSKIRLFRLL